MKTAGITGPPGSGKTSLWKAVTGGGGADIAAVAVPDARLDALVELERSRKRVPVQIQVADVHAGARSPAAATARLREMDAILCVVPVFGSQEPSAALRSLLEDLVLADTGPVENRLARARKDPAAKKEVPALEAGLEVLEGGGLLSGRPWEQADLEVFSAMAPLTLKPLVVVYNVAEDAIGKPAPDGTGGSLPSFAASAALEAEVAGMEPDEAARLLEMFGVEELVAAKLIEALYRSLDLITFYTAGDKESRAWEVRRGAAAPEAAGVIHSDMERGFIRAEVIGFDELISAGSWDGARAKGLLRVEGRTYVMAEADVVHFRFAV